MGIYAQKLLILDLYTIIVEATAVYLKDEIRCSDLEEFDLEICEAQNGKEALEKVLSFKPDLILLDMKMPEMDGYEVTRRLKADKKLKEIPVIAVTASALNKDRAIIKELCNGYIAKPVSSSSLFSELLKFLEHQVQEPKNDRLAQEIEISPVTEEEKKRTIQNFKEQYGTRLNEMIKTNKVSDIQNFAKELIVFTKENKEQELLRSAYNLDRFCQQFDITMIYKTLKYLQNI